PRSFIPAPSNLPPEPSKRAPGALHFSYCHNAIDFPAVSAHTLSWFLRESEQSNSRPMIKIAKIAVGALFLVVFTLATANAQTNSYYRTNVLLGLSITLTSYEQNYIFLSTN